MGAPSHEDLDHDYLWRSLRCLPERGRIGIHNRSWYEEVLVAKVHPEILAAQKIPPELVKKDVFEERYEDINAVERYLSRNGTVIRKSFLHVSKAEQKRRFLARLEARTGNSPAPMSRSAACGWTTSAPTRTRSAPRRPRTRPGT